MDQLAAIRKKDGKGVDNVWIGGSTLDKGFGFLFEIEDNVTITHSTVLPHDASIKMWVDRSCVGKVVIGNKVFIGWGYSSPQYKNW